MTSSAYAYTPSHVLPIIFASLIGISLLLHIWQNFRYHFWRVTFFMVWGGAVFTFGWIMRCLSSYDPENVYLYIAQTVLILAGPPIYSAAEYHVLGRLMHYLPMHAPLNPNRGVRIRMRARRAEGECVEEDSEMSELDEEPKNTTGQGRGLHGKASRDQNCREDGSFQTPQYGDVDMDVDVRNWDAEELQNRDIHESSDDLELELCHNRGKAKQGRNKPGEFTAVTQPPPGNHRNTPLNRTVDQDKENLNTGPRGLLDTKNPDGDLPPP
ncbi:hypothetical protein B7494_g7326 [Chlorociboria aeruginascens]|nr:hypothetical protein B7494_g7326 [Chlorociboria aeruginascens]